jgi:hypothetical protein
MHALIRLVDADQRGRIGLQAQHRRPVDLRVVMRVVREETFSLRDRQQAIISGHEH